MSPDQLAQQQLTTAWINAGAAVVQAIGAIAAIAAAIYLARAADRRSRQSERDSRERERVAEAASVARAEAAERAAQTAIMGRERMDQDALVKAALELADKQIHHMKLTIDQYARDYKGQIVAPFLILRPDDFAEDLKQIAAKAVFNPLAIAITDLARSISAPSRNSGTYPIDSFLGLNNNLLATIEAKRTEVAKFGSNYTPP